MQLGILYHGNCFDGAASAALFSRFFEAREGAALTAIRYRPLQHQQGDPFPPDAFSADVNAVLDFRYSPSPRLHWWFDHHQSAFQPSSDRAAYQADRSGQKFWDPAAPSNTGFMARTLAERFAFAAPDLDELVRWADVIDAARFPSAATAVRLEEPALHLMSLLEATQEPEVPTRIIEGFRSQPLAVLAAAPWVVERVRPILERHGRTVEAYRKLARLVDGVVEADVSAAGIESSNKFIAYHLFPEARYTVVVSKDAKRSKVSVGSNPWSPVARSHDISLICERYGGGGHPVVGAVSLPPERLDEARRIAGEIAALLRGPPLP